MNQRPGWQVSPRRFCFCGGATWAVVAHPFTGEAVSMGRRAV